MMANLLNILYAISAYIVLSCLVSFISAVYRHRKYEKRARKMDEIRKIGND